MTPYMRLGDLIRKWSHHRAEIEKDLHEAYALGHEFGLLRAADRVDEGWDGDAIRTLKVERVKPVATKTESFL